jgi:DNA-binding FadR family transcriptional regulator
LVPVIAARVATTLNYRLTHTLQSPPNLWARYDRNERISAASCIVIISALDAGDAETAKAEMEKHIFATATILQQARTAAVS